MNTRVRTRIAVFFATVAVVASTIVPAGIAAAEEPPVADPIVTESPAPEPEATPPVEPVEPTPVVEPVETPEPSTEPTPVESPSAEPTPTPTPSAPAGATVQYSGTAQQLSNDGIAVDEQTILFAVTGQGYLSVNVSGLDTPPDATNAVLLTLKVPAGLTLSADADTRFTQLANAGASAPLIAIASSTVKETAPRETAALVNTTPNVPAVHHVFAVYVSPTNKKVKDPAQGNNTAAAAMVTAADTYWGLQSSGTIDFVLDGVVPWYQSTYSCSTSTGSTSLWNQAMTKAKAAGFVPGKNMHLLLLMPEGGPTYSYCGGAIGLGTVGGSVNQGGLTWVMGSTSDLAKTTVSHEFGHNMSLGHADVLACLSSAPVFNASTLNYPSGTTRGSIDNCTIEDYEDVTDVMGYGLGSPYGTGGALSSPQAIRAGIWTSSAYAIAPVAVDTPYVLQPVSGHSGVRAVVVQDNDGQSYFVEYRNGTNEDLLPKTYGCDTDACVYSSPNVRILRFEPQGYQGYPGYDSLVIGRSNTNIGYTGPGTFWSGGGVNQGVKIEVVSVGASTASIKVTRTAHTTTKDWVVARTTIGYDSKLRVGDTLTAFLGDYWDADSYTFQWTRDGVNIPSSNAQNYTLTKDDLGTRIHVYVTSNPAPVGGYDNGFLSGTCVTAPNNFGIYACNGQSPVVLAGVYQSVEPGTVTINNAATPLSAVTASWPAGTTFAYKWYRGSTASTATTLITGQTASTYTPTSADVGKFLRVGVTASVPGYLPVTRYSPVKNYTITATGTAAIGTVGPIGTQLMVNSTLAYANVDGAVTPDAVQYQWLRAGVAIPGADATDDLDYTLQSADFGKAISLRITAIEAGWVTHVFTTAAKTATIKGDINGSFALPTMVKNDVPLNLTATLPAGSITESGVAYAYQWIRVNRQTLAETAITGATGAVYTPVAADYPYRLKVRVTVTKLNYNSVVLVANARDYSLRLAPSHTPLGFSGAAVVEVDQNVSAAANTYDYQLADGTPMTVVSGGGGLVESRTWFRSGVATGETGGSYFLTSADVGKLISYKLNASLVGYLPIVQLTSTNKGPVALAVLAETGSPMITGPIGPAGNLVLTAVVDETDVTPASTSAPTVQWLRNGVAIAGATQLTYKLVTADFGKSITAKVTYKRAGYQTRVMVVASSGQDIYSVLGGSAPSIEGEFKAPGSTPLEATYGSYTDGTDGTTIPNVEIDAAVTYQWLRNGVAIATPDAIGDKFYTPVLADKGKALSVRITVTLPGLLPNVQTTPATQLLGNNVLLGAFPPVQPTVSLDVASSTYTQILSAVNISGITEPGVVVKYQWLRNGVAITDATKSKYTLTSADRGKNITVRITTTKASTATQSWTKVVQVSTPVNLTLNAAPGAEIVIFTSLSTGGELSPQVPYFTDANGAGVLVFEQKWQWYRTIGTTTTAIPGAIFPSYYLQAADVGARITVKVTTGQDGYISHVATYSTTPPTLKSIKGTLVNTATAPVVTVSNPATNTLLATPPDVTGQPLWPVISTQHATFTYKWLRDGVAIPLATAPTYKLVTADKGKDINVQVTANLAGYNSAVLPVSTPMDYSIALDPVVQPYISSSNWTVGGTAYVYDYLTYITKDGALPSPVVTFQWLRSGVVIPGATDYYYPLQAADNGKFVTARLTISKPGYLPLVTTLPNAQLVGPGVTNTPAVTVVPVGLGTLGVDFTGLAPALPTPVYAYKWYRADPATPTVVTLVGSSPTYKLVAADRDKWISVQVTMTRSGFTVPTTPIDRTGGVDYTLNADDEPTINLSGPAIGTQLGVNLPVYTNPGGGVISPTLAYQWKRNGVVIASGENYTLAAADEGKTITVTVVANYSGLAPLTATTVGIGPVVKGSLGLADPQVAISDVSAARKLTVTVSGITQPGVAYAYQWFRQTGIADPVAISGQTLATYTLSQANDYGKNISVRVTVTKSGYATQTATSSGIDWSLKALNGSSVSGTPLVGEVLTANPPTSFTSHLGAAVPDGFAYQWLRNGVAIDSADATDDSDYTIVVADRGATISVRITASKSLLLPWIGVAASSGAVPREFAGTHAVPVVTKPATTLVLTAALPSGSITTTGTAISYQWYTNLGDIAGATSPTYTLIDPNDWGKLVAVRVTVSKPGYTTLVLNSIGKNYSIARMGLPNIPAPHDNPVVNSTMTFDDTTYFTNGDHYAPPASAQTIIWLANESPVDNEFINEFGQFTPQAVHIGMEISVQVITTRAGWLTSNAISAKTNAVVAGP